MAEAFVTTSWDDGHPLDLRVAGLLEKHGLPGCFFVPRENPEREVMAEAAVRELSARFEIGGHALTHRPLTRMPRAEAVAEIHGCRAWLRDLTSTPVESFCYPGGYFDQGLVREVAKAGFTGARTADWMCLFPGSDPLRIAPTVQLHPHGALVHLAHCLRRGHARPLLLWLTRLRRSTRPAQLVRGFIEVARERGGVVHLWGHSWEVEEQGLWAELEDALWALRDSGLVPIGSAELMRRVRDGRLR